MQRPKAIVVLLAWLVLLPAVQVAASEPPGVVIDTSPDFRRVYIGSPSIAILPDGAYVASHDFFGPGATHDQTAVFESSDRGQSWKKIAQLDGQFWSSLFVHRGELYIIGPSGQYEDVVIRRSADGGHTWTTPTDGNSGRLLDDGGYHCAPVPVVVHEGRIWRAMEDNRGYPGGWGRCFRAFVMSAPVDADLLKADNWTCSNRLKFEPDWLDAQRPGWLEGNIVVTPEGKLVNILRVNDDRGDMAAIVEVSDDGKTISFDPETGFIDMPGGRSKFSIRFDPVTRRYWSLVNKQRDPKAQRNVLALVSSTDLRYWKVNSIILRHVERQHHAWQYPAWLFDSQDLICASRTAWDGSHNFHDANYLTFHRVKRFRNLTMDDSSPWLGRKMLTMDNDSIRVEGSDVELGTLADGKLAYSNRKYVWDEVPEQLAGWKFTRKAGGEDATIAIQAKKRADVVVATASKQRGTDMTGWQKTHDGFRYTSGGRERMDVYRKTLEPGQRIQLPQTNWSGTIVLMPPEGLSCKEEEVR